jgi:hypothetical protein
MMREMTNREWEALSAYLDNELAPKERANLETRLKQDQDLRMALQELRRTRIVLRSQPKMRAPRNFTLTPEMAGIKQQSRPASRAYPLFRLASALATIALVLVLVGDFFTAKPAAIPISRSSAPIEAPVSPPEAQAATPAPPGMGGGSGQEPQGVAPESSAADQSTPEPSMGIMAQAPAGTPESSEQPKLFTAPSMTGTPQPSQPAAPAAKLAPTQPQAEAQEQPLQAQPVQEPTATGVVELAQPAKSVQVPDLRYIEIGLAVVALISGLIAWYLRRMSSL